MAERTAIIYRLIAPSGKSYIGFTTTSLSQRWKCHLTAVRRGIKTKLADAIRKYGPEVWTQEILLRSKNIKAIRDLESSFIRQYNAIQAGYNMCTGGEGAIGYKHTEEMKKHIAESVKRAYQNNPQLWKNSGNKQAASNVARSYNWLVRFPDNHTEVIFNLRQFCRDTGLYQANLWRTQKTGIRYKGYAVSPLGGPCHV